MIRTVWTLLGRYLPHRGRRFLGISVLSLVAAGLEAIVLVVTVRAAIAIADGVEEVTVDPPLLDELTASVPTLLWVAAACCVLSVAAGLGVAALTARVSSDVLAQTRAATLRAFSRAPWQYQAAAREGSVQEAVSTNALQATEVTISASKGLTAAISLFALLSASLFVSAWATLAVVGLGLTIVAVLRPITRATRGRATLLVESNARFAEAVAESTGLALEMRVFGVEQAEADRLAAAADETGRRSFHTRFSSDAGTTIYRSAMLLFLVGAVGGLYALGDVDLSAVGAVVVLVVRTLSYAQQVQSYTQRLHEQAPNLVALDATIAGFEAVHEPPGTVEVESISTFSLRDVSYAYEADRPALDGIDLEIQLGEMLGVVGPSGGGKSTLVQVLLRLRHPTSGQFLVDDLPADELTDSCWARLASVVPQEPRLFSGTIADNIAFHRSGITREQVVAAARKANIAGDIDQLSGGFDAELGPRGSGLSGGQRQRLAIARALVGEPHLLVLDEPTSALDIHSERLLQQTISELSGRVTMVIIAHRLSTIALCNRLLVLEQGKIAALGPYDEVRRHPFLQRAVFEAAPAEAI